MMICLIIAHSCAAIVEGWDNSTAELYWHGVWRSLTHEPYMAWRMALHGHELYTCSKRGIGGLELEVVPCTSSKEF